jgi:hypothetical protein
MGGKEKGGRRTVDFTFAFICGISAEGMSGCRRDGNSGRCAVVNTLLSFQRENKSSISHQNRH